MSNLGKDDKWEFYKDNNARKPEWRWQRTAPNGRIVGASTEGYHNKSDCLDNAIRNGFNEE
ncbi:DUF1508 domain-containing protein [Sneathiella limimaris]|uniref:DUF1508 domain-containing protein n=1 Tax=Sneathiella limimaris TaxID=1964213 RepID=UPI00146CD6C3|nr:DUF1508 domain-containing protein [Sneathiella limimaris]